MSAKKEKLDRQDRRKKDQAVSEDVIFWHGGLPGLTVGGAVLPLTQNSLGTRPVLLPAGYGANPSRRDRVYVTSDRQLARAYASRFSIKFGTGYGEGVLYRVKPHVPFAVDPDYKHFGPTLSLECLSALVTRIEESPVVMTASIANAAAGKYATWNDGKPMYDRNGAVNPDDGMRKAGLTTADTSAIWPPWTPFSLTWDADVRAYMRRVK